MVSFRPNAEYLDIAQSAVEMKRFWTGVCRAKPNECWEYIKSRDFYGYGRFFYNKKSFRTHRVAYLEHAPDTPEGLVIDHLCRNRACVNPAHLRAVTDMENNLAPHSQTFGAINKRKTHCVNGHEFTPENIYIRHINGRPARFCKECGRIRHRARMKAERDRRREERLVAQKDAPYKCGHPKTPENTVGANGDWPRCRECNIKKSRDIRARQRVESILSQAREVK